ncbi:MAG: hypothetical protein MI920_38495 [Kiloniellales bacterium]|nr:hypothetical protein [Kiloniellales bacterium]
MPRVSRDERIAAIEARVKGATSLGRDQSDLRWLIAELRKADARIAALEGSARKSPTPRSRAKLLGRSNWRKRA